MHSSPAPGPVLAFSTRPLLESARTVLRELLRHPARALSSGTRSLVGVASVLLGGDGNAEESRDRRFADPGWHAHPLYRRLYRSYQILERETHAWLDGLSINEDERARTRFFVELALAAVSPSNYLLTNPIAIRRALDSRGQSVVQGVRNLLGDIESRRLVPGQPRRDDYVLGEDIASTEGGVVHREPMFELIQYKPLRARCYERPILIVTSVINKYYLMDLNDTKSFVKRLLERGFQVFVISWNCPTRDDHNRSLRDYVRAVASAADITRTIMKGRRVNLLGACAGGMIASAAAALAAARHDNSFATLTLAVSVVDSHPEDSEFGWAAEESVVESAIAASEKVGYLPSEQLKLSFAMLRAEILIFENLVSSYLMGDPPPRNELLYWLNDQTNLSATVHKELLRMFVTNKITEHGAIVIDDTPLDLRKIKCDAYLLAAKSDHISPWRAVYRSAGLFGGNKTFVLATGGHTTPFVAVSGHPLSGHFAIEEMPPTPDEFASDAKFVDSSWLLHWCNWLAERSGRRVKVDGSVGSSQYPVVCPAPGSYVMQDASKV